MKPKQSPPKAAGASRFSSSPLALSVSFQRKLGRSNKCDCYFGTFDSQINKMQVVRFNKQNIALVCALASVLYFLLHAKTQHIEFEYEVDEKPIIVWEHVADFNNMMSLNPTILDFNIIGDKGNYKHWEYTAEYTEFLANFPSIKNKAVGHFTVKPDGSGFLIDSTHKTCFFNTYCLKSTSQFKFSQNTSKKTICRENITFQCPYFLTKICVSEVMHQRATIRDNLINFFERQQRI